MAFNRILDFSNGLDFYLGFFFSQNFINKFPSFVYTYPPNIPSYNTLTPARIIIAET